MNVWEYYQTRKQLIDEAVRNYVDREGLKEIAETALGGKRLRSVLLLMMCEALGGRVEDALDAAVAIELAHAASLDADDIIDLDELRRGRPAQWVIKGVLKVTLGTHALVSHALKLIEKYGHEVVRIFVDTYTSMVRGELMDVSTGGPYETIIGLKTASLWAAASAIGAIVAGKRDRDTLETARSYGFATGMAFQIADDAVDMVKLVEKFDLTKLRHPSVVAFLAYLGMKTLLETSPFQVIFGGLNVLKEKAMKTIMEKIDTWIGKAKQSVEKLPVVSDEYRQLLMDYPTIAIDLMFKEGGLQ